MMRPEPQTIYFGGREWTVRPLTLRQIQAIETTVNKNESALKVAGDIIKIALHRDYADAIAGSIEDTFETTGTELAVAAEAVMRLGGFLPQEEDSKKGEGKAEPAAATTGA